MIYALCLAIVCLIVVRVLYKRISDEITDAYLHGVNHEKD